MIVSGFTAALDLDTYPLGNLIRPRCAERAKPREPARIAHARAEGGGGREGKNGLAKLARFLMECLEKFRTFRRCHTLSSAIIYIHSLFLFV